MITQLKTLMLVALIFCIPMVAYAEKGGTIPSGSKGLRWEWELFM
jgi:hypothetical protein